MSGTKIFENHLPLLARSQIMVSLTIWSRWISSISGQNQLIDTQSIQSVGAYTYNGGYMLSHTKLIERLSAGIFIFTY